MRDFEFAIEGLIETLFCKEKRCCSTQKLDKRKKKTKNKMVLSFGVSKALALFVGLAFPTCVCSFVRSGRAGVWRSRIEREEQKRAKEVSLSIAWGKKKRAPPASLIELLLSLHFLTQNLPQLRFVQGSADSSDER